MIRVLIVHMGGTGSKLLQELFKPHRDFEICAEAESGADAMQKVQRLSPSLILLDLSAPSANDLGFLRTLVAISPATPVFLITDCYDVVIEKAFLSVGAAAVFSRSDEPATLIKNARALLES